MEKTKRKRHPSENSSYLPQSQKSGQETIVTALNPATIAKKRENRVKVKKLDPEHQLRIDMRIWQYVVGSCLPLSTVENILFRLLLEEVDERVVVMCVKTLKKRIVEELLKFKAMLTEKFGKAIDVCLTADAWGALCRAFLGVTAHWLSVNSDGTIERHSAALAVKRFTGNYNSYMYLISI